MMMKPAALKSLYAWTDYPFTALGDIPLTEAPVRPCVILSYDGNKYCRITVGNLTTEVKAAYLYGRPGRLGELPPIRYQDLLRLQPGWKWAKGKPASRTVRYHVWEPNYEPGMRHGPAACLRDAKRLCRRWGVGSEIQRYIETINRKGATSMVADPRIFVYRGE